MIFTFTRPSEAVCVLLLGLIEWVTRESEGDRNSHQCNVH